MTIQAQGDKLQLVTAGTASAAQPWRGGRGVLLISNFSGVGALQVVAEDGGVIPVKDINGVAVVVAAANAMFNVELPACRVQMSAGGGTMSVWLVGI